MLNALRAGAGSVIAKGLLILLALSFMIWGVTDYVGGGGVSGDVARVGSGAVTPARFMRAFDQDLRRLRAVLGPGLTREEAHAAGFSEQTAGRLIGEVLTAEEARALGVTAADELVRRNIERDPAFLSALGAFDRNRFRQIGAGLGYGEEAFIERFREDAAAAQVLSAVSGGLAAPRALTDIFMRRRAAVRTLAFFDLRADALPAPPAPSEAEISAWHAAHESRFTVPELRRVTFVRLNPDVLAGSVEISEAELAEAFEDRRSAYETPERRRVKQMILADESAAAAAKARIDGGEDFDAVALDAAGMAADAADLGLVSESGLPEDLAAAAFALAPGQTGAPVRTPFGWHVLTVTDIEPGEAASLDDARSGLTAELRRERAADEVYAVSAALEDALGGGAALEEAAEQLDLRVETLAAAAADGTDGAGARLENLPGDGAAFIEEVFAGETGIESVLTEDGGDGYFVVRVDEVSEPRLKPLAEVRAAAADGWRAEKRAELARARAEAARDAVAGGAALSEAAAELGAKVRFSPPLHRDGAPAARAAADAGAGAGAGAGEDADAGGNTPVQGLLDAAFAAGEGAAVMAETEAGFQIGRVEAAGFSDDPALEAQREAVEAQLAESLAADVARAYAQGLRARHEVTLNRPVLDALLNPQDGG